MPLLPWIAVSLVVLLLAAIAALLWALRRRARPLPPPQPSEWTLTSRPVFSSDERRVYRLLHEALPHHVVLSRLPLLRFCQPTDPAQHRYWHELLGGSHVGFAVCSANGRVIAAIDLDGERTASHRLLSTKQAVLAACRVRYLRCSATQLPTVAELQLLVPEHSHTPRGPQPAPAHRLQPVRGGPAGAVAARRAERTALWSDSACFPDAFQSPGLRQGAAPPPSADPPRPSAPTRH